MRLFLRALLIGLLPTIANSGSGVTSARNPVKTEIVERNGKFLMLRGGQPYDIRGVGILDGSIADFARRGGTSIRNWSTDHAQELLDAALEHGLTVSLCIRMGREWQGFDYNDEQAVKAQFETAKAEVLKYRNHPALLSWIIGDGLNLQLTNPRAYDAVNDISRMIHELDPNHPTTSTLAGFGKEQAELVNQRAPDLDFISIQLFGDLVKLPKYLRQSQFKRPYMVTEWGPTAHWEAPATVWGAPIEQDSSTKARNYQKAYERIIASKSPYNLGAYAALWGHRQEQTSTWYGMFLESGESTEVVDVMHRMWTGEWPANRAPQIKKMTLNKRKASNNPVLRPGREYQAKIKVVDPDGDPLRYYWEVRYELFGGDATQIPTALFGVVEGEDDSEVTIHTPDRPGAYRLFAFAYDGQGHAAHANIPFLVKP